MGWVSRLIAGSVVAACLAAAAGAESAARQQPAQHPTAAAAVAPAAAVPPAAAVALAAGQAPAVKKGVAAWAFNGVDRALARSGASWYYTWAPGHPGIAARVGRGLSR